MEEIELSIMSFDSTGSDLQAVLREFESQHRVQVLIEKLSWDTCWPEITKFALYGHGPAVSEIGSTWVASLSHMNALRPFTDREAAMLDGPAAFVPGSWRRGMLPGDRTVWAIPWLADTRVIFYRRDILAAAGIDEQTAFQTQAQLEATLERLQASGVSTPWSVPTQPTVDSLHYAASWVWSAGGDFVDEKLRRVTFADAPARAGLRAYYGLHRFMQREGHPVDTFQSESGFAQGQAAVTMGGPWLAASAQPELIGAALPPGAPFVGESHLVIWRHAVPKYEKLAFELVRFLTGKSAQVKNSQQAGLLPVRLDVLSESPFSDHPIYQVLSRGVTEGRSVPAMRLWGLIEDKLSVALGQLWAKVLAAPNPDLDTLIRAELEPLAQRLNATLESSRTR
jgi:multiple sugar transport system substrate-binding protein